MARRRPQPQSLSDGQRRLRYLGRKAALVGLVLLVAGAMILADWWGLFGRPGGGDDWQRFQGKQFRVVKVVDGDTVDIDIPDGRYSHTRIRLLGLDTPESVKPNTPVQYFGPEASARMKQLALGKTVTIQLDSTRTRDNYHRLLAYIVLDGRNLNLQMVEEGFGYADPRFKHPMMKDFSRAQAAAIKARKGMWQGLTEDDLPDYYRDGRHRLPKGAVRPAGTSRPALPMAG